MHTDLWCFFFFFLFIWILSSCFHGWMWIIHPYPTGLIHWSGVIVWNDWQDFQSYHSTWVEKNNHQHYFIPYQITNISLQLLRMIFKTAKTDHMMAWTDLMLKGWPVSDRAVKGLWWLDILCLTVRVDDATVLCDWVLFQCKVTIIPV